MPVKWLPHGDKCFFERRFFNGHINDFEEMIELNDENFLQAIKQAEKWDFSSLFIYNDEYRNFCTIQIMELLE